MIVFRSSTDSYNAFSSISYTTRFITAFIRGFPSVLKTHRSRGCSAIKRFPRHCVTFLVATHLAGARKQINKTYFASSDSLCGLRNSAKIVSLYANDG